LLLRLRERKSEIRWWKEEERRGENALMMR
jgi:hypothetical protein